MLSCPNAHAQRTVFTSIRDTTGRVVVLTQAVGTSVPGDCVAHTLVSREGQDGENIPSFNFWPFRPS